MSTPRASPALLPGTPEWMAPLSRELESVIAQRNLLTSRTRRRVLDDLATAASQSDDSHMESLRKRAVDEVLRSEKSYLRHLEIIQEFFMQPIEDRKLLPQGDFVTIFGDLKSIIQVNKELLSALEECDDCIGKVFLELAPYLKFYSTYANDFESAVKLVERWTAKNKAFRMLLGNQESRPEVQLKLNSLLITPIQRIPRYKLLLEDVIKNTPESHSDKTNLKEALAQIEAVAWHINEQLREHENSMKMVDIQKSLVGGFPKIVAPGRKLLMQGFLMKVPRAGGSSGLPRYFILFSDMLMYCKIKSGDAFKKMMLPKPNALECGCLMPLKHAKVDLLVGKGVFKITCQKEELILYSADGGSTSEDWVSAIEKAILQHRKDSATLRKESSRREPLKRPDLMKMRRESLSQIMILRRRLSSHPAPHKMVLRERTSAPNSPCMFSPKLKRPSPIDFDDLSTPKKIPRSNVENTSTPKQGTSPLMRTPNMEMMPPPPPRPASDVQLRAKRFQRPLSWRSLSLSRKDQIKSDSRRSKSALFRSPSIYEEKDSEVEDDGDVMASYLAEKICPLTPSQKPTNILHLVQKNSPDQLLSPSSLQMDIDGPKEEQNQTVRPSDNFTNGRHIASARIELSSRDVVPANNSGLSFCSLM